jgi:hypothetical protein
MSEQPDYTIVPARYAKNLWVIKPRSDGSGFKTRAARLAEALNGRWVHRSGGYHVSKARADRFKMLYAAGFDAHIKFDFRYGPKRTEADLLIPPPGE